MQKIFSYKLSILAVALLCSMFTFSQSKKQQELEERRQEIQREINQINELLFTNKTQAKSQTSLIEDLNYKVNVRRNLIKITNQQANLLTREINTNQNKISDLRTELATLKENYADMVVTSYKSKSEQSRVMFLLSSTNFKQAYKRIQYINQYSNYQKEQGQAIKAKTIELQGINTALLKQKEDKQVLINENRIAQKKLEVELKQHKTLMTSINKNLNSYTKQIKEKQQESNRIDRAIEKIIRDAIASSNKKAGSTKSTSTKFALTPEGRALAKDFVSNKGQLDWPVEKGVVKLRYGNQPHPVVKSVMIKSNGVRIATEQNAKVRAVFNGEVMAIQVPKRGTPSVYIKHGNYVSVYKNLTKISVKKGDKISKKQVFAEVMTNSSTNETVLRFSIFKDGKTENPAAWIYKM